MVLHSFTCSYVTGDKQWPYIKPSLLLSGMLPFLLKSYRRIKNTIWKTKQENTARNSILINCCFYLLFFFTLESLKQIVSICGIATVKVNKKETKTKVPPYIALSKPFFYGWKWTNFPHQTNRILIYHYFPSLLSRVQTFTLKPLSTTYYKTSMKGWSFGQTISLSFSVRSLDFLLHVKGHYFLRDIPAAQLDPKQSPLAGSPSRC